MNQQHENNGGGMKKTRKKNQAETGRLREQGALMSHLTVYFGVVFLLVLIYAMIGDNSELVAQAFKIVKYGLLVAVAWAGGSRLRRQH